MPEPLIHVARGEADFGTCTLAEAREMVDAGFFLPTDEAQVLGMSGWRPLDETITRLTAEGGDWRDKVVTGATGLSRVLGRSLGQFVAGVKAQASDEPEAMSRSRKLALEQQLPQFQKILAQHLRDKPATIVRAAVENNAVMKNVFGTLYACLPKPICRLVSREAFNSFCMEHRQRLLGEPGASTTPTPATTVDAPKTETDVISGDTPRT